MQQDQELQNLAQQNRIQKKSVRGFILAQIVATIALSSALLIYDFTVAYSAFAGGLIATLANTWFAVKVFRDRPIESSSDTAETVLATFYVGEIYKFIFTGAMFIIAFVLIKPVSVVALLVTYFLIHMTPAVVNVFSRDSQQH